MRFIYIFLVFLLGIAPDVYGLKVLHLGFHTGCMSSFREVARECSLDLVEWHILSSQASVDRLNGAPTRYLNLYNMTHERAAAIWRANEHCFSSFDLIITSDTAPLSRIFLQNGWNKPLIIWVCNRFNYCVGPGSAGGMDDEYYELFRKAVHMPNVRVVSYTPFEQYFAALYRVDIRPHLIKPIGSSERACQQSAFVGVNKSDTIFVYPGHSGGSQSQIDYLKDTCGSLFPVCCGKFNGPDDLKDFKGVVYFPYEASNIVLFENIERGIVHFIPSERFIENCIAKGEPIYYWYEPNYCEWYFGEHRDILVYFDSWKDLQYKVATTDYVFMRKKIKEFARYHRAKMLTRWRIIFDELVFGDRDR